MAVITRALKRNRLVICSLSLTAARDIAGKTACAMFAGIIRSVLVHGIIAVSTAT